jgi:hypothetical protein
MSQQTSNLISGIFITEHQMANMTMERIVVSDIAIQEILKITRLPLEDQQEAVDELVHRTPEWMDLEEAERIEKIKFVLTTETILLYLQAIDTVRDQVDIVELGVDEEGSVVVYAYYTNMNREQRRAMAKATSDEDKAKMAEAVSQFDKLSQQGNIIDLAKKKLEKMAAEKAKGKK